MSNFCVTKINEYPFPISIAGTIIKHHLNVHIIFGPCVGSSNSICRTNGFDYIIINLNIE